MFEKLAPEEIRSYCRQRLDTLEMWLRDLVSLQLSKAFGPDYMTAFRGDGSRVVKRSIADGAAARFVPSRHNRLIDAVYLDELFLLTCNPSLYNVYFSDALSQAFPAGQSVASVELHRLIEPRNKLAHSNPLSSLEISRILCLTEEVIVSLKDFYVRHNLQEEYNSPKVVRYFDSFGQSFSRSEFKDVNGHIVRTFDEDSRFYLRPGDVLNIGVEIDPSFGPETYTFVWKGLGAGALTHGLNAEIPISDSHVATRWTIQGQVHANRSWHRLQGGFDDQITLSFRVLPPRG